MKRITSTVTILLDAKMNDRHKYDAVSAEIRELSTKREQAYLDSLRESLTEQIEVKEAELEKIGKRVKAGLAELTLTSLTQFEYMNLLKRNLPREDDEIDARLGYNCDTFAGDLLRKATIAAKDGNGKKIQLDLDTWLDEEDGIGAGDFQAWFTAAHNLQTGSNANFFGRRGF